MSLSMISHRAVQFLARRFPALERHQTELTSLQMLARFSAPFPSREQFPLGASRKDRARVDLWIAASIFAKLV